MKRLIIDGTSGDVEVRIEDNNSPWGWFVWHRRRMTLSAFRDMTIHSPQDYFLGFLRWAEERKV